MLRRCLLPPRCHTNSQNAGTFLLVGRYGSLHRMVGTTLSKTSRQTTRWSTLSIPLPNSPGISVSVGYFGPLPTTARGNSYILLFTDRFSRRTDMFAVTAAEFTAEGTTNSLVNLCIPLWRCPSTLLSGNGLQFCAQIATAVSKLLGVYTNSRQAPTTLAGRGLSNA